MTLTLQEAVLAREMLARTAARCMCLENAMRRVLETSNIEVVKAVAREALKKIDP